MWKIYKSSRYVFSVLFALSLVFGQVALAQDDKKEEKKEVKKEEKSEKDASGTHGGFIPDVDCQEF